MGIIHTLKSTGIPSAYARFKDKQQPPFIVYIGAGQNNMEADNTLYWRENTYQVEYYFATKNEENEDAIEEALLRDGYLFEKSEDVPIEDEDIFVIYYDVTKGANHG